MGKANHCKNAQKTDLANESVAAEYLPKEGLELELDNVKEKEEEVEDISGDANKEEKNKRKGIINNDEDKAGNPRQDRHDAA